MPHAVFGPLTSGTDIDSLARVLVPGIEPGGSRAGQETKPGLLLRDAWFEPARIQVLTGANADFGCVVSLKLSQEFDLTPGLLLPVATVIVNRGQGDDTGSWVSDILPAQVFRAQGSVWAPRVVGLRYEFSGTAFNQFSGFVHLDYERVDVPWMDWFIMWELLDNVVDNDREY